MQFSDLFRLPTESEAAQSKWYRFGALGIVATAGVITVVEGIRRADSEGGASFSIVSDSLGLMLTALGVALALIIFQAQAIASIDNRKIAASLSEVAAHEGADVDAEAPPS